MVGGNLVDLIKIFKKIVNESSARKIIKQVVSAIIYCHSFHLAHRDIKAENIMFVEKSFDSIIKLIDFGFATVIDPKNKFSELMGSPFYLAPEVILGLGYNEKCDIWSIGMVLYFIMTGKFPYSSKKLPDLLKEIKMINFTLESFDNIKGFSKEGKKCLLRMLNSNEKIRPSAEELIKDPWFQIEFESVSLCQKDQKEIFDNIMKYKVIIIQNMHALQHAVFEYIALNMDIHGEAEHVRTIFQSWDTNGDGMLSKEELRTGINQMRSNLLSEEELNEIFSKMDLDKSDTISYTEFIAATLSEHLKYNESNIKLAFDFFDLVFSIE